MPITLFTSKIPIFFFLFHQWLMSNLIMRCIFCRNYLRKEEEEEKAEEYTNCEWIVRVHNNDVVYSVAFESRTIELWIIYVCKGIFVCSGSNCTVYGAYCSIAKKKKKWKIDDCTPYNLIGFLFGLRSFTIMKITWDSTSNMKEFLSEFIWKRNYCILSFEWPFLLCATYVYQLLK